MRALKHMLPLQFLHRHVGPRDADVKDMLKVCAAAVVMLVFHQYLATLVAGSGSCAGTVAHSHLFSFRERLLNRIRAGGGQLF